MTHPLIDRHDIEEIFTTAKAARVKYLEAKVKEVPRKAKWGSLTLLIASSMTFFGTHGGGQAASGDQTSPHKFSRYY